MKIGRVREDANDAFESLFGKDVINKKYKDFLKYMMSEECGFDICSDIDNFKNLRDFTDDDKKNYNFALENFKGKYGLQ